MNAVIIDNERGYISKSLWTDTANLTIAYPPLKDEVECDVVIVGGGYTGLSAAIHMAEAGLRVRLLEAETPGWGASGRNGGQVNPGLKADPDGIERHFGADMGSRMVTLCGNAGDFLFDLVKRLGIDCAALQTGWIQPFHNEKSKATVSARVEQWQKRGARVRLLAKDETDALLGTNLYLGSMIDERGGNLHPLNYALGLATAAQKAGAVLHAHSRALRMEQRGDKVAVKTSAGRVIARHLVIATNGYADAFSGKLGRTGVAIRSIQTATEPLSADILNAILPHGHSASDARRLLLYFRKGPNNSFIMGGRGAYSQPGTEQQFAQLRKAAVRLYPSLAGVKWRYQWGGFVCMTADHYPHLMRTANNIWACIGYNGRGVAMATTMGKVLADAICGTPDAALPFPVTMERPIPLHALRKCAVSAAVTWSRFRDAWDES